MRTFARLCSRLLRAEERSQQTAARTPGTLLAVMHEPMPAPSTTMPTSLSPEATRRATRWANFG